MKTIKQFALVIGFGALINNVWADNGTFSAPAGSPWSLSGSLGMMQYNNVYGQDGETATGRFGLEYQLLHHDYFNLGLELGLQNGNFMRLAIPEETIKLIGGMPVEVQAKPMVDLLLTSEFFSDLTPLYVLLKGGIAYRRLKQTFGDSLNDLAKFSPEVPSHSSNAEHTVSAGTTF